MKCVCNVYVHMYVMYVYMSVLYMYTILYSLLVLDELLLSPSLFGPCMGHLPLA
jgi:hypothetical protein